MEFIEPCPFSGHANVPLQTVSKQLYDQYLALSKQHKVLGSVLRSLHRDEIRLREKLRESDPARWQRVGRDEWKEMQRRFADDESRLIIGLGENSVEEDGVATLNFTYGPTRLGAKRKVKRRNDTPAKITRIDGSPDDRSSSSLQSTQDSSGDAFLEGEDEELDYEAHRFSDPFMEFVDSLQRRSVDEDRQDLGIFDPFSLYDEDTVDDGDLCLQEISDGDFDGFFGENGADIAEPGECESSGTTTPPSCISTPPSNKDV